MNNELFDRALQQASSARERAFAPYSNFRVGAAVVTSTGEVFAGCNVENASYGLTQCAERAAVAAMVAAGHLEITCCVIVTDTPTPTMPCGACRQVLLEFGREMLVVSVTTSGVIQETKLSDLLPNSFDGNTLNNRSQPE